MLYLLFENLTLPSLSIAQIKRGEEVTVHCRYAATMQFQTSVHWSTHLKDVNWKQRCSWAVWWLKPGWMRCTRFCSIWSNMQPFMPFFLHQEGLKTSRSFCCVCIDGGPKQGGNKLCQQLSLQTTHWVIPTAVNVTVLSQSLQTNPSTTCITRPKGRGSNFVSMQISTARVCFYLCLFSCYAKVWANRVCPLSPSGSHRLNDLSMLAWSTHCDEERVRVKRLSRSPFMDALYCLTDRLKSAEASCNDVFRLTWHEVWVTKWFRLCLA